MIGYSFLKDDSYTTTTPAQPGKFHAWGVENHMVTEAFREVKVNGCECFYQTANVEII